MPELTREEKLKLIEKLPERLRDFLYSEDTGAVLLYFEKKYNLSGEKAGSLSKLVTNIVLGITPITSLAQEINSKITSDAQAAMNLAQELNTELLAPAMAPAPSAPALPTRQEMAVGTPTTPLASVGAVPKPAAPRVDQYREPMAEGPEVIDLRKTPPPPMPMPVAPAPIPPSPRRSPDEGGLKPLTFTKPVALTKPTLPLIEAEPHKMPPSPAFRPPVPEFKASPLPQSEELRPQYIIRPPGLPPTDLPHDVLDLRKDKGEF